MVELLTMHMGPESVLVAARIDRADPGAAEGTEENIRVLREMADASRSGSSGSGQPPTKGGAVKASARRTSAR